MTNFIKWCSYRTIGKGSKSELTDLDMQQVFEEFMEELGLGFGGKKIGKN